MIKIKKSLFLSFLYFATRKYLDALYPLCTQLSLQSGFFPDAGGVPSSVSLLLSLGNECLDSLLLIPYSLEKKLFLMSAFVYIFWACHNF